MEIGVVALVTAVVAGILLACVPVAYVAGRASINVKEETIRAQMNLAPVNREEQRVIRVREVVERTSEIKNLNDLPYSYAVDFETPRYYQEERGTCWDLATIGILEHSYRRNGVNKSFLARDEYVRLNPQSYGISVINACKKHPDVCDVVGDEVFHGSTEGGEVWWLYSLKELYNKILPIAVCPYQLYPKDELVCDGMEEALKTNPIKLYVKSMETAYNVFDTKRMVVEHDSPVAWSSVMHNTVYYFPCNDPYWKRNVKCSASEAVKCPTDRYYGSETCARVLSSMFDMDGEFFIHGETLAEGGHAMNVVGYNDGFTTKQGHTGGFIIRNSWHDLAYGPDPSGRGARGSHSIAYWMQTISEWDEKAICPGPLNPDNWLSCVQQENGPHSGRRSSTVFPLKDASEYDITSTCLNDTFMENLLNVSLQPVEFSCLDNTVCDTDPKYRYFLINLDHSIEQDLTKACMLRYDTVTKQQDQVCTPYHIPAQLAYWFRPINSTLEKLKDDEDLCGYWFWPYETLNKQVGLFDGFFSTWFDIEWDDQSYAKNKAAHPDLDYTFIEKSTFKQKVVNFETPSPHPKQRYD